ncbi:MAG: hypothetical protein ACI4UM_01065, partial [Succinivibrio sp.]
MKLKHKLVASITGCFSLLAVCVCFYNQTAVYENAINSQYTSNGNYLKLLSSSAEKFARSASSDELSKFVTDLAKLQNDALNAFSLGILKHDYLDLSAIDYFVQSNSSSQLFESRNE